MPVAPTDDTERHGRRNDEYRRHAVLELHREHILDMVQPPWLHEVQAAWNELAIHQRVGVIGEPGAQTGDEGTEGDLDNQ